MLSEGIAATQEVEDGSTTAQKVEGRCRQIAKSCRKVDTPEIDESAGKWTEGPVNAPEVSPQQEKLTEGPSTSWK